MKLSGYGWLMLAGILISLCFWWRLARRDRRLFTIFLAALVGALIGAKIIYFAAEGWMTLGAPDMWIRLATGKSILGALLGGYTGVELAKRLLGYTQITGDWFATVVPLGIILGRAGCWVQGCCMDRVCEPTWFTMTDAAGVARWPAVPTEIVFNAMMLVIFLVWRRKQKFIGQHFHIYLIAYGVFRFLHEFLRDSPRWSGPFSGYHFAALLVAGWGIVCFARRRVNVSRTTYSNELIHTT